MRNKYSARRRSAQVDNSASQLIHNVTLAIVDHARTILGMAIDEKVVSPIVRAHYHSIPFCPATEWQAAVHESGHFVAFEVTGIGAAIAELDPPGGGEVVGWGGRACAVAVLPRELRHAVAAELRPQIISTLAGPFAEVMIAGGSAASSLSELVEARFVARRLAEMRGHDPTRIFERGIADTVAMIERHVDDIEQCANRLTIKKRILRGRFRCDGKMITSWRRSRPMPAVHAFSHPPDTLARLAIAVTDPFDALVAN